MLLDLSTFGILLRSNILTLDLIPLVNCACLSVFLDLEIYLEIKRVAGFEHIWYFVKKEVIERNTVPVNKLLLAGTVPVNKLISLLA